MVCVPEGNSANALEDFETALLLDPFDDIAMRNRAWAVQAVPHGRNREGVSVKMFEPLTLLSQKANFLMLLTAQLLTCKLYGYEYCSCTASY